MTLKEALEFLELPEGAAGNQIKQRLHEKLAYFEHLSENAPSDFLKRLNRQHFAKAKSLEQEMVQWNLSGAEVVLDDSDDASAYDESIPLTTPVIVSSKNAARQPAPVEPVAWLVRHTENQSAKTFSLFTGKNYIGRKADPALKPFIVIEDDAFVSRVHAIIYIEEGNPVKFYIADTDAANGGKASKNGTYINGNEIRITQKLLLKENDTIQVGMTKLILKLNNNSINHIIREVERSKFMHTVVFES